MGRSRGGGIEEEESMGRSRRVRISGAESEGYRCGGGGVGGGESEKAVSEG
jgi:hypothetical protein